MSELAQMQPVARSGHNVGHVDSIPRGEGRTVVLGGQRIAIFHSRNGRLFATQADCPHRGGPLADGIVAETTVVCPLHEYKFDLEDGASAGNACDRLKVYSIEVDEAGEMVVSLDASP